jgi:hypothetical protein
LTSHSCQSRMVAFDTSEATVLTTEEMGLLVVEGSGTAIKEKLEACGAEDLQRLYCGV